MSCLESLVQIFQEFNPTKIPDRRHMARAGVGAILREKSHLNGISVLLIRRAERQGDPWSGHMAFPGGRMEKDDSNIFATTIREAREEIGIDLNQDAACIGRLSDLPVTTHDRKFPMALTPFVFRLEKEPEWQLNDEVVEKMWVPFSFFKNDENRKKMEWTSGGKTHELPCYDYQDRRIWGLTLAMLDELVNLSATKRTEH